MYPTPATRRSRNRVEDVNPSEAGTHLSTLKDERLGLLEHVQVNTLPEDVHVTVFHALYSILESGYPES